MKVSKHALLVSVIIITKNQKYYLKKSIPILLGQQLKQNYEVIVVDSGSTDGAIEYIQGKSNIKLVKINPKKFNFANAFNSGAKIADGKYLIRLSGDVIPLNNDFISELIKPFKDKKVGATFGKYTIKGKKGYGYPYWWPESRFPSKITKYSQTPNPLTGIRIFGWEYRKENTNKVFELAGGCCAIRKSIWTTRSFNEKLISAEDAEYAWFLHIIGYDIVFNPKSLTIHEHKKTRPEYVSFFAKHDLTRWQFLFSWNITMYWLKRLIGIDPYKHVRIN